MAQRQQQEEVDPKYRKKIMLSKRKMALYSREPMLWLTERFGEDETSFAWTKLAGAYKTHKWDGDKDPLARAWEDLADGFWVGVEAATGTSKTYWLARVVMWYLDCHEDSLVVTSAPKEGQLKLHLWAEMTKIWHKFRKIRPGASMGSLKLRVDNTKGEDQDSEDPDLSESWQAVGFVSGVGSQEESATKAQGFHRKNMLIILEETPGISNAVMTAFQNTATGEDNIILAVGNPDSEFDPLHQFCLLKNVRNYRISAFDYPNTVLKREIFPGAVGLKSINRRIDKFGVDSPMYESRVRGISPAQSQHSLIFLKWIDQCIDNDAPADNLCFNAVGVDVANSDSGDKAAVAYGVLNTLLELKEFKCPNATHLAYNLFMSDSQLGEKQYDNYHLRRLEDYDIFGDCVGVDAVGVGVATVNALTDHGFKVQALQGGQWDEPIPLDTSLNPPKPLYKFASLRAQMYWELREDLRLGKINIRINNEQLLTQLRKELVIPKWDMRNNHVAVEKKEDIKERMGGKSPNIADAIVYWNWMRHGYRREPGELPIFGGL